MRVVFLGTPEFAVPSLLALAQHFDVVGVVTQPDRPAGRGRRSQPPPAKSLALELNLPLLQPEKIRSPEAVAGLAAWRPDVIVVAAYGQILPTKVLATPRKGCVNVHASLLPRWRGASPVQAALLHGDAETGVTIMEMDEGLDTGPVIAQRAVAIRADHNGGSLSGDLAHVGAELLIETLPQYLEGKLAAVPQDARMATLAPRLSRADAALDPNRSAAQLERQVRAFAPTPGAYVAWGQGSLRILAARRVDGPPAPPGTVVVVNGEPAMAAGEGLLGLGLLQTAGGRAVAGKAFLAGHRSLIGAVLRRPT